MSRIGRSTVVLAALLALGSPAAASLRVAPSVADSEVALAYGLLALHQGRDQEALQRLGEAAGTDPDNGAARYGLGLVLLRLGRAEDAARELRAALAARRPPEVERWQVRSDLGAAELAAGDPRGAVATLDEALRAKPDDPLLLYRHGQALERLGRAREAEAALARARGLDPGVEARSRTVVVPGLAGEVVVVADPPRWDLRLGLAAAADSNPNLLSDDLVLLDPGGGLLGDDEDQVAHLDLRFAAHAFSPSGRRTLAFTAEGRQSLHQDFDFLDLSRARGVVQAAWGRDPLGYLTGPLGYTRVPFGHDRVSLLAQAGVTYDLLDGDSYLRTVAGALTLVVREGTATATQVEVALEDQDFSQLLLGGDADGEVVSLGVSQLLYLGRRNRYLRLGVLAAERSAGAAFDSSSREGRAELSLPLGRRSTLFVAAALRQDDFDSPLSNPFSPATGPPREDTTARLTAALVWALRDRLVLTLRGTHLDRDADLGPQPAFLPSLDYERTVVSLGLAWFFAGGGGR